jgi:hypothetical protein
VLLLKHLLLAKLARCSRWGHVLLLLLLSPWLLLLCMLCVAYSVLW